MATALLPRLAWVAVSAALVLGGCSDAGDDDAERTDTGPPAPASSASDDDTPPAAPVSEDHVDVGDHDLYLRCWGEPVDGEPTILLVSGMGPDVTYWSRMATELAADGHHLCGYDRAGVGGSGLPTEDRRTTRDQVDDLLALLDGAGLDGPLVVVAHSLGSLPAIGLADRAPERVAGAVLIEPWGPRVVGRQLAALPPKQADESPDLATERAFLMSYVTDAGQNSEHLLLTACNEEAIAVLDEPGLLFGDHPVTVLQAPLPPRPAGIPQHYDAVSRDAWIDANEELAAESSDGRVVEVARTGHDIHIDRPDAVIDAILDVLAG